MDTVYAKARAIAYVSSCDFIEKWSTPRQPLCIEKSEAIITVNGGDAHILDAIEVGSWAWIIFVFHFNKATVEQRGGQQFAKIPAMIRVPKLDQGRMGCLATRSPHRPNPIGISISRVICKDERSLVIRGTDLIQSTPILDILPADYPGQPNSSELEYPGWVDKSIHAAVYRETPLRVVVAPAVLQLLKSSGDSPEDQQRVLQLTIDALKMDPRSKWSRIKHQEGLFAHRIGSDRICGYRFCPSLEILPAVTTAEGAAVTTAEGAAVTLLAIWKIAQLPRVLRVAWEEGQIEDKEGDPGGSLEVSPDREPRALLAAPISMSRKFAINWARSERFQRAMQEWYATEYMGASQPDD